MKIKWFTLCEALKTVPGICHVTKQGIQGGHDKELMTCCLQNNIDNVLKMIFFFSGNTSWNLSSGLFSKKIVPPCLRAPKSERIDLYLKNKLAFVHRIFNNTLRTWLERYCQRWVYNSYRNPFWEHSAYLFKNFSIFFFFLEQVGHTKFSLLSLCLWQEAHCILPLTCFKWHAENYDSPQSTF